MLIPLTRATLEQLIPAVATGTQYTYYWGKIQDLIKRLLFSVIGVTIVLIIGLTLSSALGPIVSIPKFFLGVAAGFYWFWGPIYVASRKNFEYRKYRYSGFWQGEILDVYVTEELIGMEETVNNRGDLVRVENRERYLNLEVGDRDNFTTRLQAPLRKEHRPIRAGQKIQLVVLSKDPNLTRIAKTTDAYLPQLNLWFSDYPFLQREAFRSISSRLTQGARYDQRRSTTERSTEDQYEDRYSNNRNIDRSLQNRSSSPYSDRSYDDRDYDDRDYDDRDYNDRDYDDRDYNDRDYNDRDYNDRDYDDRDYNDRDYNDRDYDDRNDQFTQNRRSRRDRDYDDLDYGDASYNDSDYGDSDYNAPDFNDLSYDAPDYDAPDYDRERRPIRDRSADRRQPTSPDPLSLGSRFAAWADQRFPPQNRPSRPPGPVDRRDWSDDDDW